MPQRIRWGGWAFRKTSWPTPRSWPTPPGSPGQVLTVDGGLLAGG
ncbi:MAG: hypothetical protein ABS910_13150 [Arthrobacter sp.]